MHFRSITIILLHQMGNIGKIMGTKQKAWEVRKYVFYVHWSNFLNLFFENKNSNASRVILSFVFYPSRPSRRSAYNYIWTGSVSNKYFWEIHMYVFMHVSYLFMQKRLACFARLKHNTLTSIFLFHKYVGRYRRKFKLVVVSWIPIYH